MFRNLRWRLAAVNALVMLVVLAVLAAGILLLTDKLLLLQESSTLQSQAAATWRELQEHPGHLGPESGGSNLGTFHLVWDAGGRPAYDPSGISAGPFRAAARRAASGHPGITTVEVKGEDVMVDSRPLPLGEGRRGVLQTAHSLAAVDAVERETALVVVGAGAGGLILSLFAAWFMAGRAIGPVERAFARQREFAADASHELRTPLAVIDAGLQILARHPQETIAQNQEPVEAAAREVARMRRLVEGLLTLARADSGAAVLERTDSDLGALVSETAQAIAPLAAAHGSSLRVVESAGGHAWVDPDRVRQLLFILLDNALTHTPKGTAVEIGSRRRGHREVVVEVADRGPGIPEAARARVFERFRRAGGGRSAGGAGLGLSIAAWLAAAHGGSISLLDNRPGLLVRVVLPERPPAWTPSGGERRPWWWRLPLPRRRASET